MFSPSWLTLAFFAFCLTHLLIILVTVYFHRAMAHQAVKLDAKVLKIFRFLSWFMMGMDPQEFAAVHRKHHALCDTSEDPHSPVRFGWLHVLFKGVLLYRNEVNNPETVEKYGKGLPYDKWESFYHRFSFLGVLIQGLLWVSLFGYKGFLLWGVLLIWIPFWAAGVINGLGHRFGYRRYPTDDHSTNLIPWGFWLGGEELHNNHHARPSSPKFSTAWYEFDLGWVYIRLLMALGLASLRSPWPDNIINQTLKNKNSLHLSPEKVLLSDRYHWMRSLYMAFDKEASEKLRQFGFKKWKGFSRRLLPNQFLSSKKSSALQDPLLFKLHTLEEKLRVLWTTRLRPQDFSMRLNEWMKEARQVGPHVAQWCDHFNQFNLSNNLVKQSR